MLVGHWHVGIALDVFLKIEVWPNLTVCTRHIRVCHAYLTEIPFGAEDSWRDLPVARSKKPLCAIKRSTSFHGTTIYLRRSGTGSCEEMVLEDSTIQTTLKQ